VTPESRCTVFFSCKISVFRYFKKTGFKTGIPVHRTGLFCTTEMRSHNSNRPKAHNLTLPNLKRSPHLESKINNDFSLIVTASEK